MKIVVIAVILICLGIIGISKHLRILRRGVAVDARVSEIKRSAGRHKYDNVFLTFSTPDGQKATGRSDETVNKFKVGDTVPIIYLRDNPAKVYTTAGKPVAGYILVALGVALLIIHLY